MKKFTIQFQDGPGTRWLEDDDRIAMYLQTVANVVAAVNTGGTKPAVHVVREECVCEICQEELHASPQPQLQSQSC